MFARFSLRSADTTDDNLTLIERFGRTGLTASVNGARCWIFTKKSRSMGNFSSTLNALLQHISRFILQGSSWCQNQSMLQLLAYQRMSIGETAKSCQELANCGCKKSCSRQWKCNKAGFRYIELFQCSGGCTVKVFCSKGWGFLLTFSIWVYGSYIFQKVLKICNRLTNNIAIF